MEEVREEAWTSQGALKVELLLVNENNSWSKPKCELKREHLLSDHTLGLGSLLPSLRVCPSLLSHVTPQRESFASILNEGRYRGPEGLSLIWGEGLSLQIYWCLGIMD